MRGSSKLLLRWLTRGVLMVASGHAFAASCDWPEWQAFKRDTMSADGRVIDASSAQQITVSEGQSYALFFALVANDRATFDKVLDWTQDNLAQGDITHHLPSWIWGKPPANAPADAKPWDVLDANSASDADVWIAYDLIEAGRLWNDRRYTALGTVLARNTAKQESAMLPGLGRTLLPGAMGFQIDKDTWRLNPSYVPLQVIRGLANALPAQPEWKLMLDSSLKVVTQTAPRGFSPDWVLYRRDKGFVADAPDKAEAAYNAIRVYLWAGTLAADDPLRASVLPVFQPMADYVAAHGEPPERVNTQTGAVGANAGNAGFSAAVAPYLAALGRQDLASAQAARTRAAAQQSPLGYYSSVLQLFGLGFLDGRYRFDASGRLVSAWSVACPAPS